MTVGDLSSFYILARVMRRGSHCTAIGLEARNGAVASIDWCFTADDARTKH